MYTESSLLAKLNEQRKLNPKKQPVCLFSDLDDSFILKYWPSEDILDRLSQRFTDTILSPDLTIYEPTVLLRQYLEMQHIPLVIVSGRDLYQMEELKKKFTQDLPAYPDIMDFDAIIGAVGTEIYIRSKNGYERDTQYAHLLDQTNYNRERIFVILAALIPKIRKKYNPVAFDFSKRDKEGSVDELPKLPYKISYEFKSDAVTAAAIEKTIGAELKKNGLEKMKILVSCPYAIDNHINKYNVDIVPMSKDKPITYLKALLDVKAVVAGDSGNDFDMITKAADCAIIVGNAKVELKKKIAALKHPVNQQIIVCPETLIGPEAILTSLQELCNKTL